MFTLFSLLLCISLLSLTNGSNIDGVCQTNDCMFGSRYIKVYSRTNGLSSDSSGDHVPVSFDEANAHCASVYQSQLATVEAADDDDDENSIEEARDACVLDTFGDNCWIGLQYRNGEEIPTGSTEGYDESLWRWVSDGESLVTSNWAPGEPTTSRGAGLYSLQYCAAILYASDGGKDNKWDDYYCEGESAINTQVVTAFLCDNPNYGGNLACLCDCATCSAIGDPHYCTFDETIHHFMGNCSYDYVTRCDNGVLDKSVDNGIPFDISAEHYECYREGATCMKSVFVTLYDENQNEAVCIRLSEGLVAEYATGGSGAVSKGSVISFGGSSYGFKVYDGSDPTELILEAYYRDSQYRYFDVKVSIAQDYKEKGDGSYVYVTMSECYKERNCGLCGTWNDDASDDFTYYDNEVKQEISTSGVDKLYDISIDAWDRTHEFGNKYHNVDVVNKANQKYCGTPPTIPPPELPDCPDDNPYCGCIEVYECCGCDEPDFNDDNDYFYTFLSYCMFDANQAADGELGNPLIYPTTQDALESGIFDGVIQNCQRACGATEFKTPHPTQQDTPAPTPNPTPNPTPSPVVNPTPRPTPNPTPSPVADPTPRPTRQPADPPTERPSEPQTTEGTGPWWNSVVEPQWYYGPDRAYFGPIKDYPGPGANKWGKSGKDDYDSNDPESQWYGWYYWKKY